MAGLLNDAIASTPRNNTMIVLFITFLPPFYEVTWLNITAVAILQFIQLKIKKQ
jgi:hypothetical protein